MDRNQIIIFAFVILYLAFRIYQKYIKKEKKGDANNSKNSKEQSSFSYKKEDDYEPYSKK